MASHRGLDGIVVAFVAALGLAVMLRAPDPLIVLVMIPIIFTIAANAGVVATALSAKPLYLLGELSFSIYLVHLPLILAIRHYTSAPLAVIALTIPITLMVSVVTYRLIEVPARERSKRFAADITPRLGAVTST